MAAAGCSALLVLLLAIAGGAQGQGWKAGRASFYGMDGWSIHKGSCGFGYCWPDIGTGWDVAAIADASPEFPGSCGRCYEVKCDPKMVVDGYGNRIDRSSGSCKYPDATVIVRTVDTCPCVYPSNAYSNKRWCCGDNGVTHFDLSVWAFEKLADKKLGVIGLKYRQVDCDYKPSNPAPPLANPTPGESPPQGAKKPTDYTYVKRTDWAGQSQGAVNAMADPPHASDAAHVSFDSLFVGGGAFDANPTGATNQYALSKVMGGGLSSSSASASSSSGGSYSSSSTYASASGSGSASAFSSAGPMVMAFGGAAENEGSTTGGQSSSGSTACSDTPAPGYTCAQQKVWGKCQDDFLVKGKFCEATCGRCSASSSSPAPSHSPSPAPAQSSSSGSQSGTQPGTVYYMGFVDGWGSWGYSSSFSERSKAGVNGDQATCGKVDTYGAWQAGNPGSDKATGKSALQLWVDSPQAAFSINLGSSSATCTAKSLKSLGVSEQQAGFSKIYIPLSSFGCPFGADQITRVIVATTQAGTQNLCISDVRFI